MLRYDSKRNLFGALQEFNSYVSSYVFNVNYEEGTINVCERLKRNAATLHGKGWAFTVNTEAFTTNVSIHMRNGVIGYVTKDQDKSNASKSILT